MAEAKEWRMCTDGSPLFTEYLQLGAAAGWEKIVSKADVELQATDALIVVDMQNDFIPVDSKNPHGGAFGVAEGGNVVDLIVKLMEKFASAGAMVIATRDYHPIDHCSFIPSGGPFPSHCIQGSIGSQFYESIGKSVHRLRKAHGDQVHIVFKGFHEDVDSFGSFEYPDCETTWSRITHGDHPERLHGCTLSAWTGCIELKCSNINSDVNAPPDILAAHRRVTLAELLKNAGIKRVFGCGLALDFCVLDTCLNGVSAGFEESYMILDAARAAHLPGIGTVGSGFLQDPAGLLEKMNDKSVKLVPSVSLLPDLSIGSDAEVVDADAGSHFPAKLGPFGMVPVDDCKFSVDRENRRYSATLQQGSDELAIMIQHGLKAEGPCSPHSELTLPLEERMGLGIPFAAVSFAWANPADGIIDSMDDHKRGYMCTCSPLSAFLSSGGFVYFDADGNVLKVMALTLGNGLTFHGPAPFRRGYAAQISDRWQPVTLNDFRARGAVLFAWINPGEVLQPGEGGGEPWTAAEHGAFAYHFGEDLAEHDPRDVLFAISGLRDHDPMGCAVGRLGLQSCWSTSTLVPKESTKDLAPLEPAVEDKVIEEPTCTKGPEPSAPVEPVEVTCRSCKNTGVTFTGEVCVCKYGKAKAKAADAGARKSSSVCSVQ